MQQPAFSVCLIPNDYNAENTGVPNVHRKVFLKFSDNVFLRLLCDRVL